MKGSAHRCLRSTSALHRSVHQPSCCPQQSVPASPVHAVHAHCAGSQADAGHLCKALPSAPGGAPGHAPLLSQAVGMAMLRIRCCRVLPEGLEAPRPGLSKALRTLGTAAKASDPGMWATFTASGPRRCATAACSCRGADVSLKALCGLAGGHSIKLSGSRLAVDTCHCILGPATVTQPPGSAGEVCRPQCLHMTCGHAGARWAQPHRWGAQLLRQAVLGLVSASVPAAAPALYVAALSNCLAS